jgi:hypothetical protein
MIPFQQAYPMICELTLCWMKGKSYIEDHFSWNHVYTAGWKSCVGGFLSPAS